MDAPGRCKIARWRCLPGAWPRLSDPTARARRRCCIWRRACWSRQWARCRFLAFRRARSHMRRCRAWVLGRKLNPRWDGVLARARMQKLGIPLDRRAGKLSGGQQAQVALVLALAKRPDLLLLDEPLASLDPLARREFLRTLMEAVAESGLTVLLSSHIIGDLERVCDYLIILSASRVQLAGDIQEILKEHKRLIGPRQDEAAVASVHTVIEADHTRRQTTLLVRSHGPLFDPAWEVQEVALEDIVLAYLSQQTASTRDGSAGEAVASASPSTQEHNGMEVLK